MGMKPEEKARQKARIEARWGVEVVAPEHSEPQDMGTLMDQEEAQMNIDAHSSGVQFDVPKPKPKPKRAPTKKAKK
jgi:hypothetical protein